MASATVGQKRRAGRKTSEPVVIRIQVQNGMGNPRWITADLIDTSPIGIAISLVTVLQPGSAVTVRGRFGENPLDTPQRAAVRWCAESSSGTFRAGLEFLDVSPEPEHQEETATLDPEEADHYEVMQLSPNADRETVDRVYRLLAQRYHPDNTRSGNSEVFLRLSEAHRVLSDPQLRAQYDAHYRETKQIHWKIFDQTLTESGQEAEQRKRRGILGLLYAKTLHDPERGAMTIFEFEDLLGCPREHLQAALWYLRGKGYIQRSDNGRHTITVQGFEEAEKHPISGQNAENRLLNPGNLT